MKSEVVVTLSLYQELDDVDKTDRKINVTVNCQCTSNMSIWPDQTLVRFSHVRDALINQTRTNNSMGR